MPNARRRNLRVVTAALVSPVILLGLAKLAVGLDRHKPVGLLLFLLAATAIAALAIAVVRSHASRAGRALLAAHKAEHSRALRAPRRGEVIAAFAIAGTAALAATEFEAYGRLIGAESDAGVAVGGDGGGGCGGCSG